MWQSSSIAAVVEALCGLFPETWRRDSHSSGEIKSGSAAIRLIARGSRPLHTLIASPFLDEHLVLRPDDPRAVKVGADRYRDLLAAATRSDSAVPPWLADAARQR